MLPAVLGNPDWRGLFHSGHGGSGMSDRAVVFLDWQNVYKGAREAFCAPLAPYWEGQVDPVALAQHLAADSPYDRELQQVRIYRGRPDSSLDPKGYAASSRQAGVWPQ